MGLPCMYGGLEVGVVGCVMGVVGSEVGLVGLWWVWLEMSVVGIGWTGVCIDWGGYGGY